MTNTPQELVAKWRREADENELNSLEADSIGLDKPAHTHHVRQELLRENANELEASLAAQGPIIERGLETPRRIGAVETLIAEGWKWDGKAWLRPEQTVGPSETVAPIGHVRGVVSQQRGQFAAIEFIGPDTLPYGTQLFASPQPRGVGVADLSLSHAKLVGAAGLMLAEIDTCGHNVDPGYRETLHDAWTEGKALIASASGVSKRQTGEDE